MKTRNYRNLVVSGLVATVLACATSCEKGLTDPSPEQYLSIIEVADDGTTTFIENNLKSTMVETPDPGNSELDLLLHMKEEEKLARDIYLFLYETWGSPVFKRISEAESNHLNAVIHLLKYYGSPDTLVADTGVFTIPEFQELYQELIAKGSVSVEEAFMTGSLIEEMDIKDLKEALAVSVNENVLRVFEHLLKGSRNHLRAFYLQLSNLSLIYTPVYITQEEYNEIVSTPMEQGLQYKKQDQGMHHRYGQGNGQNRETGNGNGNNGNKGRGNGGGRGH